MKSTRLPKLVIHPSFVIYTFVSLYSGFLIEAALLTSVIILHEIGHVLMIKIFKGQVTHLTLSIVGVQANSYKQSDAFWPNFMIAIAGISVNAISILVLSIWPDFPQRDLLRSFNIGMIILNLLPIFPLDGSLIIQSVLLHFYDSEYTYDLIKWLSWLVLAFLCLAVILYQSMGLLIICLFLCFNVLSIKKRKEEAYLLSSPVFFMKYKFRGHTD